MANFIKNIDWLLLPDYLKHRSEHLWKWINVLLMFITLEIPVLSLEQAHWIKSQPYLTVVLFLAVLLVLVLTESRLSSRWKWSIVIFTGVGISIWQTSILLPKSEVIPWIERFIDAVRSSLQVLSMNGTDENSIHFAIFLVILTWLISCFSTWYLLKKQNPWPAVITGAVILLLNLSNLPDNFHGFLFVFLIASVLLIAYTRLMKQRSLSIESGINLSYTGTRYFMISVLCISLVAISISWLIPENTDSKLASTAIMEKPLVKNVEEYLTNFFARVPRKEPLMKAAEQDIYSFTEVYERNSKDVHYIITSDSPHYWRTRMYDIYTSSGWANSFTTKYQPENGSRAVQEIQSGRIEQKFGVEVQLKTDIIITAGEFLSADIPTYIYTLDIADMENLSQPSGEGITVNIVTPQILDKGKVYNVTSSVISATPGELAEAGDTYPDWTKTFFLQLPESLPERVRQLSENITGNSTTPYEKVLAISENISRFRYDLKAGTAPDTVDGVDDFLFNRQAGACADFASAMTVLLRASGVPARFCVGYRSGEWNSISNKYIIRASNRHAWTEVYFPGYGWVDFEATPGSTIPRGIVGVEAITTNGTRTDWNAYLQTLSITPPYDVYDYGVYTTPKNKTSASSPRSGLLTVIWFETGILILLSAILLINKVRRYRLTRLVEGQDYASEIYGGMCELASQAGLGPKPQQTALEYSRQLVKEFPDQAKAINEIVHAFIEWRFGGKGASTSPGWELMQSRRAVYTAIRNRMSD